MRNKKYTLESIAEKIISFLTPLLERAGIQVTPSVTEPVARFNDFENPEIAVNFSGPDVDLLLENRAELLLALEHLTLEMLRVAPDEHALVIFDANDYRMLRIEELRLSAVTAADKVKSSHQPFRFGPMTSRERRILHLAVSKMPDVRSESSGVGPHRGVVIYPADMPSMPERNVSAPLRRRGRR